MLTPVFLYDPPPDCDSVPWSPCSTKQERIIAGSLLDLLEPIRTTNELITLECPKRNFAWGFSLNGPCQRGETTSSKNLRPKRSPNTHLGHSKLTTPTARFSIYGMFNNMGFLIHGFPIVVLRPGGTVKLHFSVPAQMSKCSQNLAQIRTNSY